MTYFAIQALDALGATAVHPIHFMAQFEMLAQSRVGLIDWTGAIPGWRPTG